MSTIRIVSSLVLVLVLSNNLLPAQEVQQTQKQDVANAKVLQEDDTQETKKTRDVHKLRPQFGTEELIAKSEAAIQQGLDFLVKTQNKDGSWGSHDPKIANLLNFGFKTGNRGSQDAVRIACTAICAEALLFQPKLSKAQQAALDKATDELLKVHKFAFHPGETFNTWGYGYKLGFLVQLNLTDTDGKYTKRLEAAAQSCVDGLLRYQQHTGGWGYYAGVMKDYQSMSFNTAFFGLSLYRAKKIGLSVPEGLVIDAAEAVKRQQAPDGSFVYSSDHEKNASGILANLGSGSRTISSALALFEMGVYNKNQLKQALKVFANGENYLEQGRKLIQPHSAVHQISGYFFFFGYNYATEVALALGDEVSQKRWDRLAWTMLRTQEKNGCWWDTAAADYGDKWGTGFAIQSLQRYLSEMEKRGVTKKPSGESSELKDETGNAQSDDEDMPKQKAVDDQ